MAADRQPGYADIRDFYHEALMTGDIDQPAGAILRRALQAAGVWRWDLRTGAVDLSVLAAGLLCCPRVQLLGYAGFIASILANDRMIAKRALGNSVAAWGRGHCRNWSATD